MCKLQVANQSGRTQLDTYLKEPTLDFDFLEHMDVLEWWKNNSQRFWNLALMARDLLSIPITRLHQNLHLALVLEFLTSIGILFCLKMWKQLFALLVGSMVFLKVIYLF